MNIQTIKTKIENLKTQQSHLVFSIETARAKVRTINDQIKILEEVIGIQRVIPRSKKRDPKSERGRNNAATFEILSAATHPMTGDNVRKMWPSDLKIQSVYPTLNNLTKKRKIDRIQIERDGRKPCYAYTIKGRVKAEHLGKP